MLSQLSLLDSRKEMKLKFSKCPYFLKLLLVARHNLKANMQKEIQIELIKKGADEWNKWRIDNKEVKINFANCDLSNFNLFQCNLSGAHLFRTNFTGANLSYTNLTKADLSESNLSEANLSNANLDLADLTKAKVKEVDFTNASVRSAKLYFCDFENVKLIGTSFNSSKFYKATFSGIDLSGVSFRNADLPRSNLSGSNLWKADFTEANLSGSNFSNTYISEPINSKDYKTNFCYSISIIADFNKADLNSVDFSKAKLSGANFTGADFRNAKLTGADFSGAFFYNAKLEGANLVETNLSGAYLTNTFLANADLTKANLSRATLICSNMGGTNLTEANLSYSDLSGAFLTRSNLDQADLHGADLSEVSLIQASIDGTIFTNCIVYGISAWGLKGIPKKQSNIRITSSTEPEITVDDLQVAQFIYLLLNRENLRNIINTIASKSVLILGRFIPERKKILEAIAGELRKYNLLPIIFDFERPTSKDFTETIKTLAGLSLFVIVDITNPKSSPLELQATVPDYQIPFVPIIQEGESPFSMMVDLIGKYDWMLDPVLSYSSIDNLISGFKRAIIDRAWKKHQELQIKKTEVIKTQSINDFIN